jgi:glutathione-regulated potassium-efflux system ancillary protein KefG
MEPKRTLILFVHPAYEKSRANRLLLQAVHDLEHVTIHDLYEEYPDFNIDIEREKALLVEHDLIVLQHPFYWYSSPALLKEWLDLVLEYGFAYGTGGTALQGKQLLTTITTGGSPDAYRPEGINRFTMRQFLIPFEQTAVLCGMRYLPPFVAHSMHLRPQAEVLDEYAQGYRRVLTALRDGELDDGLLEQQEYMTEILRSKGWLPEEVY